MEHLGSVDEQCGAICPHWLHRVQKAFGRTSSEGVAVFPVYFFVYHLFPLLGGSVEKEKGVTYYDR